MVIRSHYLKQIVPFVGTDVIKVITGMRRCGKSVIMEQIRDWILREKGANAKIYYLDLIEMTIVARYCRNVIVYCHESIG